MGQEQPDEPSGFIGNVLKKEKLEDVLQLCIL